MVVSTYFIYFFITCTHCYDLWNGSCLAILTLAVSSTNIVGQNKFHSKVMFLLQGAIIGIDDEDDSTFTITVDHKTFHFQGTYSLS